MPMNFCTNCGQRLQLPARFCDNCGTPIPAGSEKEGYYPAQDSRSAGSGMMGRPGAQHFQEPMAAAEETRPYGLNESTINSILAPSLMHTPLDTQFLFLRNEQRGWQTWVPVTAIDNLKGPQALATAVVSYFIPGMEFSYAVDISRNKVAPEVGTAYYQLEKEVGYEVHVYVNFKPQDYGQITQSITGRWMTCVDNEGRRDVRLITQFPISGRMLRHRLQEHETWVAAMASRTRDPKVKQTLDHVLASLRPAIQQMPDGFANHIYCIAFAQQNEQRLPTVLTDPEPDTADRFAALPQAFQMAAAGYGAAKSIVSGGRPPKISIAGKCSGSVASQNVIRLGSAGPGQNREIFPGDKPKWR